MSAFFWPEPSTDFDARVVDPGENALSRYFVSQKGKLLFTQDPVGKWAPIGADQIGRFNVCQKHFMGFLGENGCYAIETDTAGDAEFTDLRARLEDFDNLMFNLAGRALQICDWYRTHQFCGQCGTPTTPHAQDRAMSCENCGHHFYPRLSPSIIVLVHKGDEVLLGRNHLFPPDLFSTLAGFVEPGEAIEETVRREVFEEVGLEVGDLAYRGSQPWPFPNSLMLGFHAEYDAGVINLQEDEIAEADWFALDKLPRIPGKFAISRWLIDDYLTLRGYPV